MTYSPHRSLGHTTPSPTRLNRFSERYKALTESPARDITETFSIVHKSSPLRPTYNAEHKIFEKDKYAAYEIQNEDRGSWRQEEMVNDKPMDVSDEVEMTDIKKSPRRSLKGRVERKQKKQTQTVQHYDSDEQQVQHPTEKDQQETSVPPQTEQPSKEEQQQQPEEQERSHQNELQAQPLEKQVHSNQHRQPRKMEAKPIKTAAAKQDNIPRYMRSTVSFHEKGSRTKGAEAKDNLLKSRTKGGISKRVGTSKVPRFTPTTKINASKDIKNEMSPGDTFVSMAARIKMFERGLGNASHKSSPTGPKRKTSAASITTTSRSPSATAMSPQSSQSKQSTSSIPRYLRQTSSSLNKMHHPKPISKEVKPSPDNSSELLEDKHPKAFKERLNLWKNRVKQASIERKYEGQTIAKGSKRKTPNDSTRSQQQNKKHHKGN